MASGWRAERYTARLAMPSGRSARPSCSTKFRTWLNAGHARIAPEHLFDRLRNLERKSARELTALG
jgi:hypothetical protein